MIDKDIHRVFCPDDDDPRAFRSVHKRLYTDSIPLSSRPLGTGQSWIVLCARLVKLVLNRQKTPSKKNTYGAET